MGRIDIRTCTRKGLADVADLLPLKPDATGYMTRDQIIAYLEKVYFDNPWYSERYPSLVYANGDGRIDGFLGVIPLTLTQGSRQVLVCQCNNYFVRDDASGKRSPFIALAMERAFLAGDQDMSITDTANDVSRKIWEACGGRTSHLYSYNWIRPIRPLSATVEIASLFKDNGLPLSSVLGPLSRAADLVMTPVAKRLARRDHGLQRTPFRQDEALALLRKEKRYDLKPAYDADTFDWLLEMAEGKWGKGTIHKALVRTQDGKAVGWYIFQINGRGHAETLQIYAVADHAIGVLGGMIEAAEEAGALLAYGGADPAMMGAYRQNMCMSYDGPWALVHARDPALLQSFFEGRAFFSGLEGERWTRFNRLFQI